MRNKILVSITAGLAIAGLAMLIVSDHDQTAPALAAPAKSTTAKPASAPSRATLPAGANATEVYGKLGEEVKALSRQASTAAPEDAVRIFSDMEEKFVAFRSKYPNTPEANDAAFQLGAMNYSMQRYDVASQLLTEYIAKSGPADHEQQAYAHFYLGDTYKNQGSYDKAEAEYKLVLSKYSEVDAQLTQVVQVNLQGLDTERVLAIGGAPLDFNVTGIDGKKLSPAAYKGKVLLIDFWATWCGPCVAEMPNVKQVYAKYHPQGFEIVGISLDKSRDRLDQYIKTNEISWPQYYDGKWWNNDIAVRYGIKSIPSTILVDRAGKIRYKSVRGRQLETAVQQLLAEKS
jgi:thiol-disulfide isomerase/thioredoxin/TolA-binding protein